MTTAIHYFHIVAGYTPASPLPGVHAVDLLKLQRFMGGYIEAIAFTDGTSGADGDELAELDLTTEGPEGWGDGQLAAMLADCDSFMVAARPVIAARLGLGDLWADGEPYTNTRCAHDFWLTRNGHGAGFWSRRFTYGEEGDEVSGLGDELSALVGHGTAYPQRDAYRGDDGRAYLA